MTAVQLDIYFMMLSKMRPTDASHVKYEISLKEIEEKTGRIWQYNQLRDATLNLIGKVFEIEESDGLLQVAMLSSAKYVRGKGTIQLSVAEDMKPYLVQLKNNFTSFELYCVLNMSSKYAKWLYVQFSRWKDKGYLTIKVEQLRKQLNLNDQYKQWGQFKENVLEPAIRQINKASDIRISYEIEKKGKTIHRLNFHIKYVPQYQIMIPFELSETDQEAAGLKRRMHKIGILDAKLIEQALAGAEMRLKTIKVLYDIDLKKDGLKNPGGYFRKVMGL
jgi:plasmid replication initiation protein